VDILCVLLLIDHFLSRSPDFFVGLLKDVMYSAKAVPARNCRVTANRAEALVAKPGVRHFEHVCWIQ